MYHYSQTPRTLLFHQQYPADADSQLVGTNEDDYDHVKDHQKTSQGQDNRGRGSSQTLVGINFRTLYQRFSNNLS